MRVLSALQTRVGHIADFRPLLDSRDKLGHDAQLDSMWALLDSSGQSDKLSS